jgi:hypothetical protein
MWITKRVFLFYCIIIPLTKSLLSARLQKRSENKEDTAMRACLIWILDVFGWHIAEKKFPFCVNGQPLKDFPVSRPKIIEYIDSVVLGSSTQEVVALVPGRGISKIKTPGELRTFLKQGVLISINLVGH